ncbi:MAG: hypothetical protein CM1200mP12_22060 [Gammaproteobacteria bacterium]|nr:MAG: hypothetical protein CM1200mP12_22060 [Gammaproteobacteria bacterium]
MNYKLLNLGILLGVILSFLLGCSNDTVVIEDYSQIEESEIGKTESYNQYRNVYFGDTHIHTTFSFYAYILGNMNTPDEAYRYAKGEGMKNSFGIDMKIREPLDFYAVTDHGFWMGVVDEWADTTTELSKHPLAKPYHNINSPENLNFDTGIRRITLFRQNYGKFTQTRGGYWKLFKAWLANDVSLGSASFDYNAHREAWTEVAKAAQKHNDPGNFTTFIGYEWTSSFLPPDGGAYHRNVLFNSSKAPKRPFTRVDSQNPEDLWTWMDTMREKGLDSLAIPHNPNQSNGQAFRLAYYDGRPLDQAYAEQRMRNEPLVEITQIKGTSETHPRLSPNDEWAGFEILNTRKGKTNFYSSPPGSYVREALMNGMALEREDRGNPFKLGFIGSSDNHNSSGSYEEDNYFGTTPVTGAPETRASIPLNGLYGGMRTAQFAASGLAGVWAEENTREAIFNALRRKETFGTSGNRIKLRFFGGFDLTSIDLSTEDLAKQAYGKGVPMGSDLMGRGTKAPSFIVWAQSDSYGAPLQRIQIIKGWYDHSYKKETREKIYDVACSDGLKVDPLTQRCPDNGAKVNLSNCSISNNKGATELKTVWTDPDFEPGVEAFYYVRVLENPTCRWTTWDAIRTGNEIRPGVDTIIQERAWSSPIWYKINN